MTQQSKFTLKQTVVDPVLTIGLSWNENIMCLKVKFLT